MESKKQDLAIAYAMKKKAKKYSKGGMIANDVEPIADEMPAQFDVLAMEEGPEFKETAENSGDELGEECEGGMVERIMRSRGKKA